MLTALSAWLAFESEVAVDDSEADDDADVTSAVATFAGLLADVTVRGGITGRVVYRD